MQVVLTCLEFSEFEEEVLVGCHQRPQHADVVVRVNERDALGVHEVG